ncbi:MAG: hypothetical protein WKF30_06225 [Pyrinomonadaceae bacterium]
MRLAHLLIVKSLVETVFISALAAGYYLRITPPVYRGWSEITAHGIGGWVENRARAAEPVEVQLYVDGKFFSSTIATLPRPDVLAAGRAGDERCGFDFDTALLGAGAHRARTFAVHQAEDDAPRSLIAFGPILRIGVGAHRKVNEPVGEARD